MPVEMITREGDFIIKNGLKADIFRVRADEDSFTVSMGQPASLTMAVEDAEELRDWLTRRLTEAI